MTVHHAIAERTNHLAMAVVVGQGGRQHLSALGWDQGVLVNAGLRREKWMWNSLSLHCFTAVIPGWYKCGRMFYEIWPESAVCILWSVTNLYWRSLFNQQFALKQKNLTNFYVFPTQALQVYHLCWSVWMAYCQRCSLFLVGFFCSHCLSCQ